MDDNAALQQAKRPVSIAAGPYGHPLHPMIVTIPIGAWTCAIVFDIVAFFVDDATPFEIGARWLVAIGVIGAVIAAIFGLMDLSRLATGTMARRTALIHMTINLTVVVLFIVSFLVRLASDADHVNVWAFIVAVIGWVLVGVSGYLGGKLAYHYGVRVASETTQIDGFRDAADRG